MKIQMKIAALGIMAMMASSMHANRVDIYNYTPYKVTGTATFAKGGGYFPEMFPASVEIDPRRSDKDKAIRWRKKWGDYLMSLVININNVTLGKTPIGPRHVLRELIFSIPDDVWFEVRQDKSGKFYVTCSDKLYDTMDQDINGHWIFFRE